MSFASVIVAGFLLVAALLLTLRIRIVSTVLISTMHTLPTSGGVKVLPEEQ